MAVKISGLNLLNANYYGRIRIVQNSNDYNVHIERTGPKTPKGLFETISPVFVNNQNQSDRDKIIAIVASFLQYATIDKIAQGVRLGAKPCDLVSGTRTLKLQIGSPLSETVEQMVLQKYLEDRLKFCVKNNSFKEIVIMTSSATAYRIQKDLYTDEPKEMTFGLLCESGKIKEFEKQFFERFITDKLNECGEKATFNYGHLPFILETDEYLSGFAYLLCGDLKISVWSKKELIEMVEQMVDKHNKEIEQSKKIQLKMEGF